MAWGVVHLPGAVASAYTVDSLVKLIYRGVMSRELTHKRKWVLGPACMVQAKGGLGTLGGPVSLHRASSAQEGWAKGPSQPALGKQRG